jgi:FkbM family methyltransferase
LKSILTHIVRLLATLSASLNLDLLWRVVGHLSPTDRQYLLLRLLQGQAELLTFRRDGTLWTGFVWDTDITWDTFRNDVRHKSEIEALLSWMSQFGRLTPARRVVVDIGANIGTSSIPFAQWADCEVIAIEPVPENFALLQQNVRQNGLAGRIHCKQLGVSDVQGRVQMVLLENRSGGAEVLHPVSRPSFTRREAIRAVIEIETDTLTHIVQSCGVFPDQIALVWSDTQGHEGHVIRSGTPLWLAGVPLYVEIEPALLRAQNGLELLLDGAKEFFEFFIQGGDLVEFGNDAATRPVSELADLVSRLTPGAGLENVLLIPRKPASVNVMAGR